MPFVGSFAVGTVPGCVHDSERHIAAGLDELDYLAVQRVRHLLTVHLDDDVTLAHTRTVGRTTRPANQSIKTSLKILSLKVATSIFGAYYSIHFDWAPD